MSLFPTAQRPSHLVEFNAGKCIKDGSTLKPDTRKGVIYMDQSDDQLMHFYWKERKATEPEDDFIIFPDEAELLRVDECTTGRVYILKFKSSNQKVFYWMQSKNQEKDNELVNRVNQIINDPQSAALNEEGDHEGGGDLDFDENSPRSNLMRILGGGGVGGQGGDLDMNMTHDDLLQIMQNGLGNLSSALPATSGENIVPSSTWTNLSSRLAEISVSSEEQAALDVGDALSADTLNAILDDTEIRSALFPFVSEQNSNRSEEEAERLVQSQQFQQRLHVLNTALQQDRLTFIVEELETEKDLESFLKAVGQQAKLKERSQSDDMDEDL